MKILRFRETISSGKAFFSKKKKKTMKASFLTLKLTPTLLTSTSIHL